MKLLTASCVAALLATTAMYAQTTTGSTVVGSMTVTATVTLPTTSSGSTSRKTNVANEIFVLRTSTGKIEYKMSASGTKVVQTDGSIDQATTGEVFNALAAEAVRQGTSLGYTSGSGTVQTSVSSESRIDRMGSGINTQFDPDETSPTMQQIFNVSADGTSVEYVGTYTQTSGSESSLIQ